MKLKRSLLPIFILSFILAVGAFLSIAFLPVERVGAEADGEAIAMAKGASVRKAEPYGIRFRASVCDELVADDEVSFGMTIIPYDWVSRYSLSGDYIAKLDATGLSYRKFDCTPIKDDNDYYIQASLTNLLESNLERKFIGIAYYEKNGVKTYSFDKNCVRSIKDVATKALIADENDDFSQSQKEFLLHSAKAVYCSGNDHFLTFDRAIKGSDVIELYYRKITEGDIRFSLKDSTNPRADQNFYGFYNIENDVSAFDGITVESAGRYHKIIIDPSFLDVTTGDPSYIAGFDTIFFSGEDNAELEIIGLCVKEKENKNDHAQGSDPWAVDCYGEDEDENTEEPEEPDPVKPLKIAIFADIQLAGERNMNSTANAYLALKNHFKYAKSIGADVLFMSGDIVNNAIAVKNADITSSTTQAQLEAYYVQFEHAFKEVYGTDESTYPEIVYNMGNHEWWDRRENECPEAVSFFKKYARIESPNLVRQSAVTYYNNSTETLPTYYKVIKGVPFLAISGENSSGKIGNEMKAEIASWLKEIAQLDSVKNGGPIYVSYHYPIPEVSYKGERAIAANKTIDDLLKDYPSAIVFTGDTHFNGINERTINQVDYTSINIGTSSYSRHPSESATGFKYDNINSAGRGSITGDVGFKYEYTPTIMIAETYSDKTVINRYFTADDPSATKKVGIAWEFPNTTDKEHFVYTNDRIQNVEWANKLYGKDGLTFETGAKVRYNVEGGKMMITFPDVTDYNYAEHYRIEIKDAANASNVKYYDYIGHYYKQDEEPHIFSFVLENLPDAANYVVKVTAYDFFDNPCLAPLTATAEDETLAFADAIDIKTLDCYSDISKRINYQVKAEGSNSSVEYYYRGNRYFKAGMTLNAVIRKDNSANLGSLLSVTDWSEAVLTFKVKNPNDFALIFGLSLVIDDNGTEKWITDFGVMNRIEVPANSDWTTIEWNFAEVFGITTDSVSQLGIKVGVPAGIADTENGYEISFYVDGIDVVNAAGDPNENMTVLSKILVVSDVHISDNEKTQDNLRSTLLYAVDNNVDAIIFDGDSVDLAKEEYYDIIDGVFTEVFGGINEEDRPEFIFNMGNHDFYPSGKCAHEETDYAREFGLFKAFAEKWGASIEDNVFVRDINGIKCVLAFPSADRYTIAANDIVIGGETVKKKGEIVYLAAGGAFSQNDVNKVKAKLDEILLSGYDKPILFCTHHPLGETYGATLYGMDETSTECFKEMLADYPQVVHLSGHTHFTSLHDRDIAQSDYTSIHIGTHTYGKYVSGADKDENGDLLSYDNISGLRYTAIDPKAQAYHGQTHFGILLTFDDEKMTAQRIYLSTGEVYPHGEWVVPYGITQDNKHEKFYYEAGERTGETLNFGEDTALKAKVVDGILTEISFKDVDEYWACEGYEIVIGDENGNVLKRILWSSLFWVGLEEKQTYVVPVGGVPQKDGYTVRLRAIDFFGRYSEPYDDLSIVQSSAETHENAVLTLAGNTYQLDMPSNDNYSTVTFYYKIDSGTKFGVAIINTGDMQNYYGYLYFDANGEEKDYAGVVCEKQSDDYIFVTINLSQVTVKTGNDPVPDTVGRFYISRKYSSADIYLDEISFKK